MNLRMLVVVMVTCAIGWFVLACSCCTMLTDFDHFNYAAELGEDLDAGNVDAAELGEDLDAAEQLEHDAGNVVDDAAELEHDAGKVDAAAELEHDASAHQTSFPGTWHVTRISEKVDWPCTDAYGNVRDPSASETWTIEEKKATGSKLGTFTWSVVDIAAELVNATVTGSVTLTSSSTFAGSLRIKGQSPSPQGGGWFTCYTTQAVQGTR